MTYIRTSICETCGAGAREADTGAWYCRQYPLGEDHCQDWQWERLIDDVLAPQAVTLIRRIHDEAKRRELAIAWADGLSDLLYPRAEFDTAAFLAACGLHPLAVAR